LSILVSAAPVSIAVPGVSCVGLEQSLCDSFLERFVVVLTERGTVRAVAQKDIAQVLGLERQRQLLGCSDDKNSSCLAELAGALGVDGIVSMTITRSDPYFVATARVVHTRDGSQWVASSQRVKKEGELFDTMDSIATKFRSELGETLERERNPGAGRFVRWIPAIVGAVAVGVGTGVFLSASSDKTQLTSGTLMPSEVSGYVESGRTKQQLGVGLWIGGGVAIAASVLWVLLTPIEEAPKVALIPINGGAAFSFGGTFP
jgi:hypothetical protein